MKSCAREELGYFQKNLAYWKAQVPYECNFCSTYFLAVTYQFVTNNHVNSKTRNKGLVKLLKTGV